MKHLYEVSENDTYVAESVQEALALWTADTGCTVEDLDNGVEDIREVDDRRIITAMVEDDGEIAEDGKGTRTTKAAIEWADQYPKGLLFSHEY